MPGRPATRYEDLPAEILLLVAETSLQQNLHSPAGNAVPVFASLNTHLAAVHAAPLAASTAMLALSTATRSASFGAALHRLDEVPPQYRGLCAETAWATFLRRSQKLSMKHTEALLARLLDSAAGRAAVQPPLWQRAVGFLLHRRESVASPAIARQLLRCLAAQPGAASPTGWPRLLQLVGAASSGRGQENGFFDTPGLGAVQQRDLAIMLEYCDPTRQHQDAASLEACIRRVETEVSAPCRLAVLKVLNRYWPMIPMADHLRARGALVEALLRVPMCDREAGLRSLPLVSTAGDRQQVVLREVTRMPAEAALRVLVRYAADFAWHPAGRSRFVELCAGFARQSAAHPALHRAVVRQIARASASTRAQPLCTRLAALALQECARHGAPERTAVLALLAPGSLPNGAWHAEWDHALGSLRTMIGSASAAQAQRCVAALLPGLRLAEERPRVLELIHLALGLLPAPALADALHDVARGFWAASCKVRDEDFARLLVLCTGLPFYLRDRPLAAMDQLTIGTSHSAWHQLQTLRHRTLADQQAHVSHVSDAAGRAASARP